MMKKIIILLFVLLFCSCSLQNNKRQVLPGCEVQGSSVVTHIQKNNVNVYSMSDIFSPKMYKLHYGDEVTVVNVIKNEKKINGSKGNWMYVYYKNEKNRYSAGYVKSKNVKFEKKFEPGKISVVEFIPAKKNRGELLKIKVTRNTSFKEDIITTVSPHKEPEQNFYTFRWNDGNSTPEFFCTDLSGTFIWYPDSNEVKHISYIGSESESAWTIVSDDLNYLFDDGGTSSGPRALNVFDLSTGKRVFNGQHFGSLEMKNNEITIAVKVYDSRIIKDSIEENLMSNLEEYLEENKKYLHSYSIYAVYRYNYVQNTKIFIEFTKVVQQ